MKTRRSGFTLVELLVVIAIIGILVALLLPAVQAAREASRRAQCKSHLKQLGLAALNHESTHRFFPTGGWGWRWGGDPDRGYGHRQPSGWYYSVLPYTELAPLREIGNDGLPNVVTPEQTAGGRERVKTHVDLFMCPSRRSQSQFPFVANTDYRNVDRPDVVARNDYAGCAGSLYPMFGIAEGPALGAGGAMPDPTAYSAYSPGSVGRSIVKITGGPEIPQGDGVVLVLSETRIAEITDGTAKSILFGEKHIPQDDYETAAGAANNQGWDLGFDIDINRWTKLPPLADTGKITQMEFPLLNELSLFGGPHPSGCQFAFCDGSVKTISYDVDGETFRKLGSINDGEVVTSP